MATTTAFYQEVLATAQKASTETGVAVSVILAQWAIETGYGTSTAFLTGNNFAGVSYFTANSYGTGVTNFPSRAAGLTAYISAMLQPTYAAVRSGSTPIAQATALGQSPWATEHYGTPPGSDLVTLIESQNLTRFTSGATLTSATTSKITSIYSTGAGPTARNNAFSTFQKHYPQVVRPALGMGSTAATNQIWINGTNAAVLLGKALITVQVTLSIQKASTITLSIHDPTRKIVNLPEFQQASTLSFGTYIFELFSVEKSRSVLTATFIPYVVAALMKATGPFTIAPGVMTRTTFAQLLVTQIQTAHFTAPTPAWLRTQDKGYQHTNKEQLSRGTIDNPLESSWTALQRLAAEVQWVCFECMNRVYFGPYNYLIAGTPVFTFAEFTAGVTLVTGTWTVGQPLSDLSVTCVADSFTPLPGQCVTPAKLGVFSTKWIVSEMTRPDIEEPTITVSCIQPLPGLPTPSSGGTNPAVGSGAGNVQTTAGRTAAKLALAFAKQQLGKGYSETLALRLGPTYFDCSGLAYEAYQAAGITIGLNTYQDWTTGMGGARVPTGVANLEPGDLLYFGPSVGGASTHMAIVVSTTTAHGTATVVEAADPTQGVIETSNVVVTVGAAYGTLVYLGATRPAP